MTTLIIISAFCWIAGFFVNKITLYQILVIVPTIMFCVRKVGIHLKMSNIVTAEVMFIIFSSIWKLLFHKFVIWKFFVSLLLRIIFICVVIYDDTVYVYKQEERKKV